MEWYADDGETSCPSRFNKVYLQIHNANAKLLDVDTFLTTRLDQKLFEQKFSHLHLSFKSHAVLVGYSAIEHQAVINEETSKILRDLLSFGSCRLEAYPSVESHKFLTEKTATTDRHYYLPVDIVVYGSATASKSVGKLLSSARIYLQHPRYQDPDTAYDNPHVLDLAKLFANSGLTTPSRTGTHTPNTYMTANSTKPKEKVDNDHTQLQLYQKISRVLGSLTRYKSLTRLEADIKVTATLLPHQEEALEFMSQREFGPTPSEYSLWSRRKRDGQDFYENCITKSRTADAPDETIGGILADDMGLGKTLTVISTIIRTSGSATEFAQGRNKAKKVHSDDGSGGNRLHSRATLVIVPSPLLIDGWKNEIEMHCDGSLNVNSYHGRGREVDASTLADWDIVLTTYHTVAADASDTDCPLKKLIWYRIVLDEAHIIRRMSTKLFQAVFQLEAKFRWCLTGTPIQNSLEDLASLVAFIRCSPLDSLSEFRKHVISPLLKDTNEETSHLRNLLDAVCLRRTKKLLNLPEVVDQDRYVHFSTAEKAYYDETQADMVAIVKKQDSHTRSSKDYFGIFQLQLQLRRLCNHGTVQKVFSRSLKDDIQFDPAQALDLLKQKRKANCAYCNVHIDELEGFIDQTKGNFTVCGHLICSQCVPQHDSSISSEPIGSQQCPVCETPLGPDHYINSASCSQTPSGSEDLSSWGTSSKISLLIHDIETTNHEGKSIIFSSWTRSLDLVGRHLTQHNLTFVRIDGTYTLTQRQNILNSFDKEPGTRILLMTTGTGAVGLNLTIADHVYILEPQWNPMVESQAIARVLRIGQKKEVKVTRYIVKGTVEEGMRSQQLRKLGYAKLGWRD
ncbi:SNF2 family N-terminal domain-containing protein [Rhexocercosporidium sp. MPI-PUGE-AT-0058]|nr:SNF2 family N-terminal domain-containing protein [Rhexocercosporidium sp. MPI-PUGE-AT-0058]